MKMSFEEQFPSHKNWSQTPTINSDGDMTIHISDMMKHCLDKQRVRDVLDYVETSNWEVMPEEIVKRIKRELGL